MAFDLHEGPRGVDIQEGPRACVLKARVAQRAVQNKDYCCSVCVFGLSPAAPAALPAGAPPPPLAPAATRRLHSARAAGQAGQAATSSDTLVHAGGAGSSIAYHLGPKTFPTDLALCHLAPASGTRPPTYGR